MAVFRGQTEYLCLGMGQNILEKGNIGPVFHRGKDLGGAAQSVQYRLGKPGSLRLQKSQFVHDYQRLRRYIGQTGYPKGVKH